MSLRDLPTSSSSKCKGANSRHHMAAKDIPLPLIQSKIASGMSHIIHRMVNKNLQNQCLQMLHTDDLAEVEARIHYVLQQIDKDIEKENIEKQNAIKIKSTTKGKPCGKMPSKTKQQITVGVPTTSRRGNKLK